MPEMCYIHTEEFFVFEEEDETYVPENGSVTEEDLYEYFETEDENKENEENKDIDETHIPQSNPNDNTYNTNDSEA